jgi:hypothetical protein
MVIEVSALREGESVRRRIASSSVSIYDDPEFDGSRMYYTAEALEAVLKAELVGLPDLGGLPVRTRSKVAKSLVCEALGYVAPPSFARTQPRLRHPGIDVYVQESNNLQVWNEEVDAARRYVIIIVKGGFIADVYVIAGADLAQFDTTGTLTSKYQASRLVESEGAVLVSERDTPGLIDAYDPGPLVPLATSPVELPDRGRVLEISSVFAFLAPMVGQTYSDPGLTQERNRGSVVHREACERLGLSHFADHGQFPDVLSQLVEVKLQLARTIDLGLELPNSDNPLASVNGAVAVRDCRYAIFYGDRYGSTFTITALVVVTGADFFTEFRQFGGRVSNSKLQLRLPSTWFA